MIKQQLPFKTEPSGPIETLLVQTPGLSYVRRTTRLDGDGQMNEGWEAVGSKGRGYRVVFGKTIPDAIQILTEVPYHRQEEEERIVPRMQENGVSLFIQALTTGKTEGDLFTEAGTFITYIKHNWERKQVFPVGIWTVRAGTSLREYAFHGDTMREILGKALLFGKHNIHILGRDEGSIYAKGYLPGLGVKVEGQTGIQTQIREEDLHALIKGEKLFQ